MNLSDQEILQNIQAGKQETFENLFRTYFQALSQYASSIIHSPEDGEEIVQDLFFQVWEKRQQLHITSSLKSYLYRSVRNRCLNFIKHQKVREKYRQEAIQQFSEAVKETDEESPELAEKIQNAIASLPARCREVFELSRFEGLKYREIADVMEISPKTVEVQMGKALKTLREELKAYL
jgi:RNA polymerase sigma-70 factor (ECF subfamily)